MLAKLMKMVEGEEKSMGGYEPCGKPQGIVMRNDDTRRTMDDKI